MTQLTRAQAAQYLLDAGCPTTVITTNAGFQVPTHALLTGIGCAESDLVVEAINSSNSNGTTDHGVWQINDGAWPDWDHERLRRDPAYCAQAAVHVLLKQGLRAWYAYQLKDGSPGPYLKKMPPGHGGPDLIRGSRGLVVQSWQEFLNSSTPTPSPLLVPDGDFGAKTASATVAWKRKHHNDGHGTVNARVWAKAGLL